MAVWKRPWTLDSSRTWRFSFLACSLTWLESCRFFCLENQGLCQYSRHLKASEDFFPHVYFYCISLQKCHYLECLFFPLTTSLLFPSPIYFHQFPYSPSDLFPVSVLVSLVSCLYVLWIMKRDISSGPPCCNTGILKQSDNYVSLFLFHQEFSIFYLTLHVKKFIGGQYRWVIF